MNKNIFFITYNKRLAEATRAVLRRINKEVVIASNKMEIERFIDRHYQIVIFEGLGDCSPKEIVNILDKQSHLTTTERWFLSRRSLKGIERAQKKKEWLLSQILPVSVSPLEISALLKKQAPAPKTQQISINTLRLLSQIWSSKSSMMVQGAKSKIIFSKGSIVSQDGLKTLDTLLQEEYVRPAPVEVKSDKDNWKQVGAYLFSLSKEIPPTQWLNEHRKEGIRFMNDEAKDVLLSLSEIAEMQQNKPLSEYEQNIQKTVYGLWKMGLMQWRELAIQVKQESNISIVEVRNLLKRDLAKVEGATPYEILGILKDAGISEITAVKKRMELRYAKMKDDYPYSAEIGRMATQMLNVVNEAVQKLLGGEFVEEEEGAPEHEKLYQYGLLQIKKHNWALADKALSRANQLCIEDAKILSAQGWAEFNNPEKDKESREKNGLEAMLLSLHLNKQELQSLLFITKAYLRLDDPENALGPVKKASMLSPDPAVQELRKEVEKRLSQKKEES